MQEIGVKEDITEVDMKSLMETFVSIDDWEVYKVDKTMHRINHASIRLLTLDLQSSASYSWQ